MNKLLVIQSAFTGDVVLATAISEKLHAAFPDAAIHMLVRKGNEGLLAHHPYIGRVWIWDKKKDKNRGLLRLALQIRKERYTHVINPHRFASSGAIVLLSGAPYRSGFSKNPLSFGYTRKLPHIISQPYDNNPIHEVARNQSLIADITDATPAMPRLYPGQDEMAKAKAIVDGRYICLSPSSVWCPTQFPVDKWAALIVALPIDIPVFLLGAPGDANLGDKIVTLAGRSGVVNLCGKMNFLESAALMANAVMNYSNDSAPLHMASAVGAPVTAVFCSTVPAFGFGPLRENGRVVEVAGRLDCRPCGLHGRRECPKGHFNCAMNITNKDLLWWT